MSQTEYEAAVAEFIRSKGITRCPTVCLAPTQGSVDLSDQIALRQRAGASKSFANGHAASAMSF